MAGRTTTNTPTRSVTSKEYTSLKKELDELKTSVDEQGETLNKIHQAIVGDKDFGHEGLVAMVRKHERWIESQKFMKMFVFYNKMISVPELTMFIIKTHFK